MFFLYIYIYTQLQHYFAQLRIIFSVFFISHNCRQFFLSVTLYQNCSMISCNYDFCFHNFIIIIFHNLTVTIFLIFEETCFPMSWHTVVLWQPLQQSNTASLQSTASGEIHVALCKHQARNTHTFTHAGHLIHLSSSCWVCRPSWHHAETSQCISLIWTSVQKNLLQQEEAVSVNQSRYRWIDFR